MAAQHFAKLNFPPMLSDDRFSHLVSFFNMEFDVIHGYIVDSFEKHTRSCISIDLETLSSVMRYQQTRVHQLVRFRPAGE